MTFNLWTFLFEVLNFLVLAFVLRRLLYRPLREAIEQRQQAIARAREEAEKATQEATELQQRLQAQLAEQEQERQRLLQAAHDQAEVERKKLLGEAERVVRERQEEHRKALERERAEAQQALQGEMAGMAIELARRLLAEAADANLDRQLVLRLIETLRNLSDIDREQLCRQWQPADGAVLETAQEPDAATRAQLMDAVAGLLGSGVTPAVQVRSDLLGGARLRLGGQVWDASLAGQLVDGGEESKCLHGQSK